ncbi:hypothetical protein BJ978_001431 [Agromyces terreus]|uniref:Uncharacterized protein n=1 Tax=Agromyces terreus TaxID=424795 RepID=A0A9X2GX86_9MICO|nr:hypothetical protein [Agromyces terreus]MCP2370755.1 hypothetical protein [Agromyces terreus]
MTETAPVDDSQPAKVRWFRRRPPAEYDRFLRGVWWAGHGQFFIAAALPFVAVITFGFVDIDERSVYLGVLFLTLAIPFWYSGWLLRGLAGFLPPAHPKPRVFDWVGRIYILILAVAGIGVHAIIGVIMQVLAAIMLGSTIASVT